LKALEEIELYLGSTRVDATPVSSILMSNTWDATDAIARINERVLLARDL
jgi:hypothetical protein